MLAVKGVMMRSGLGKNPERIAPPTEYAASSECGEISTVRIGSLGKNHSAPKLPCQLRLIVTTEIRFGRVAIILMEGHSGCSKPW